MDQINETEKIPRRSNGNASLWRAIYGTITLVVVGVQAWTAKTLVAHESQISVLQSRDEDKQGRISSLESKGSTALQNHEAQDNQRIADINKNLDRHEAAVVSLTSTVAMLPGKLDTMAERMNNIERSQARVEAALQKHMEAK